MSSDLEARLAALSPAKRALLEQRLAQASQPMIGDLSLTQQGLWFLDRLLPRSPLYTLGWSVRMRGDLDVAVLRAAVRQIVARHDVLRTRFDLVDGIPRQIVRHDVTVEVPVRDSTAAEVAESCRAAYGVGFDVTEAPLLRLEVLRTAPDDHTLILLVHHLVSDAVSFDVLLADLAECYRALRTGTAPAPPPSAARYLAFARLQRRTLRGDKLRGLLDFWIPALSGAPAVIDLPTDHPRPAVASYAGAEFRFRLPLPLCRRMSEFARGERATTYMTLLAALTVVLFRYSSQPDICVGAPVSGRMRPEFERTVGYFINTVVLRSDLSGGPTFRGHLRASRRMCLSAFDHQELPFDRLVQELRPEPSLSYNPLFQVLFLSQYRQDRELGFPDVEVADVQPLLGMGYSRFDLSLYTFEDESGIEVRIEYSTDLFEHATIERLARHFEVTLDRALADPDRPIDRIEIGPDRGSELLRAPMHAVPETTLAQLFDAQVARTPDAVAVAVDDHMYTYAELDRRANALAGRLSAAGAGPDRVVAVAHPRSIELVVALVAVAKAGAAFLPLDPRHPRERLSAMVDDARPVVAVGSGVPGVPDLGQHADPDPPPAAHPDNLAYVIFTSGSTGRPKGAAVSHRSIVNRLLWAETVLGLTSADRVLQKTPATFDVAVWEFFLPLICGAAVVMIAPDGHRDPAYLARVINERNVTVAHFVPSMLEVFLETPAARSCTGLRQIVSSGEALTRTLITRCRRTLDVELYNLYGPTETAVDVASWRCDEDEDAIDPPLGHPVWNTGLYVLDPALAPVAPGVVGELYIGGVQLARGYVNMPGRTAAGFLPDPFGADGSRMYRSGDLARWRPDGAVEYLGRADDQIKIRGVRIELGELEFVLREHPAVAAAVVAAHDGRLVAYVSPVDAHAEDVRAWVSERLPDHMVPEAVCPLAEFPVTRNGKLDRAALPPPPERRSDNHYLAGRNAVERIVIVIWSEVLQAARIGVHDDFFALGGHSLHAARAALLISEMLGAELTVATVFRHTTPAALARSIEDSCADRAALHETATAAETILALSDEEVRSQLGE